MLRYLLVLGVLVDPLLATVYPRRECTPGSKDIYAYNATLLDKSGTDNFGIYRGQQEPGSGYDEILNGVRYVRPGNGFEPQSTYYEKIDVNGQEEHPIYTFLKSHCPYVDTTYRTGNLFYSPQNVGDVSWNYEKFLIGRDGKPYTRYHPTTTGTGILKRDIDYLLAQTPPF